MFKLRDQTYGIHQIRNIIGSKPLGRWSKPKSKEIEDTKALMANYDIVEIPYGTPKTLKEDKDKILFNKKVNKVKNKTIKKISINYTF